MKTTLIALFAISILLVAHALHGQPAQAAHRGERSEASVVERIIKAGGSRPDWWDETPMKHPGTLDLTWKKRKQKWNPDKHPGHYMVSVVNRRPDLWRSSVKMLDGIVRARDTDPLGRYDAAHWLAHVYAHFLEDYARGAYWWMAIEKKGRRLERGQAIALAECYWKLGSPSMARNLLRRVDRGTVKLWSDMGDLDQALRAAERESHGNPRPEAIWIAAAGACRRHDQPAKAISYYKRIIGRNTTKRNKRLQTWAHEGTEALESWRDMDIATLTDGVYEGSATGFRGPIEVKVAIQNGHLESVDVVNHTEDWFGRALTDTPEKLVRRQGPVGVDAVTAATRTSDAIITATIRAAERAR